MENKNLPRGVNTYGQKKVRVVSAFDLGELQFIMRLCISLLLAMKSQRLQLKHSLDLESKVMLLLLVFVVVFPERALSWSYWKRGAQMLFW